MSESIAAPGGTRDWFVVPWRTVWDRLKLAPQAIPGVSPLSHQRSERSPFPYEVHRSHLEMLGFKADLVKLAFQDRTPGIELRPHQIEAIEFIRSRRGTLLADEQRLGKTGAVMYGHEPSNGPMFVIGPLAARAVWHEWAARRFGACVDQVLAEDDAQDGASYRPCPICDRIKAPITDRPSFLSLEGNTFLPEMIGRFQPHVMFITFQVTKTWRELALTLPTVGVRSLGTLTIDEAHLGGMQNRKSLTVESIRWLNTITHRTICATGTPLFNKVKGIWPLVDICCPTAFGDYWSFARRYCTHEDTPLWMGDYSHKRIGDVKVGDEVIGWRKRVRTVKGGRDALAREELCRARVVAVRRRRAHTVRVRFASGDSVICTPDHLWRNFNTDLSHGNGSNLKKPKKDDRYFYTHAKVGRTLMKVATVHPELGIDATYMRGYVQGALEGDGCVKQYRYETGGIKGSQAVLRVINKEFARRFATYAKACGFDVSIKDQPRWFTVSLKGGDKTYRSLMDWRPQGLAAWRGWLAGIYDAEGHGETFAQYKDVNPITYARIVEGLRMFGFDFREESKAVRLRGGRAELLRFFALVRPTLFYKLDRSVLCGRFRQPDKVVAIEPYGTATVVSLTTTTGNYVAGGHASKNCGAYPGEHGWVDSGSSNEDELRMRLKEVMLRRTWIQVRPDLPPIERSTEIVALSQRDKDEVEELAARMRLESGNAKTQVGILSRLRRLFAKTKLKYAVDLIFRTVVEDQHTTVAWAWHTEVAHDLVRDLRERGIQAYGPIVGATTPKEREKILTQARDHVGPRVIVANILALGTAVNLAWATHEVFVELDWNPPNIAQAEMRPFDGVNSVSAIYLVADCDTDQALMEALRTKLDAQDRLGLRAGVGDVSEVLGRTFGVDPSDLDALAEMLCANALGEV